MAPVRSALLGVLLAYSANAAAAQRLSGPESALMDEVLDVRVVGLRPLQRVRLTATTLDSTGREWRAEADFVARQSGDVVLCRDAPVTGSYTGVDPMGLVTSMDLPGQNGSAVYLPPALGEIALRIRLEIDNRPVDSLVISRSFAAAGVRSISLGAPDGVIGTLFTPAQRRRAPGVLVLGGSEGGNAGVAIAALLASRGFVAMSLAYFGIESLPRELDEIPLEYFAQALAILSTRAEVDSTALAIVGTSKGAEAALLIAAADPRVRAVVAYAPSSVVWSCICARSERSSWSRNAAGVPNVPPGQDPTITNTAGQPIRPTLHYRYRLQNAVAVERATIPVENINGPVMLIAGGADMMWPSADMVAQLQRRLSLVSRPAGDTVLIYPEAGHRIGKSFLPAGSTRVAGGRIETGGSPRANALAQRESWPEVLNFLARALRR